MGIIRIKKQKLPSVNAGIREIDKNVSSVGNSNRMPVYPRKNYSICSAMGNKRSTSDGKAYTNYQTYYLMSGNKRFTMSGSTNLSVGMSGHSNSAIVSKYPELIVNNPKLDIDDEFIDFAYNYAALVAVTKKGYVYSGGNNDVGCLGHGDTVNRYSLTRVENTTNVCFGPISSTLASVRAVKCFMSGGPTSSERSTFVIDDLGRVWASGSNGSSNLGDASTTQRNSFQRVGTLTNVVDMYMSANTIFAKLNDDSVYTWGYNGYGQMGLGDTTNRTTPTLSATNVEKIITSNDYNGSFMLKNDKTVWFAGYSDGSSPNGIDTASKSTWTQITTNLSGKNVVDITSSGTGSYRAAWALIDDGTIWSWGYNGYGALGDGTTTSRNTPVSFQLPIDFPKINNIRSCGGSNVWFLLGWNDETGRIISCGVFAEGALGQSTTIWSATWPIENTAGARAHYPSRETESPPPVRDGFAKIRNIYLSNVASSAFDTAVHCLLDDGSVWARGGNRYGQLGIRSSLFNQAAQHNIGGGELNVINWIQVDF